MTTTTKNRLENDSIKAQIQIHMIFSNSRSHFFEYIEKITSSLRC
jgi:hypothetical protein